MIYKIAELLRDEISSLDFVEIAAGLAKPVIVRNNATKPDDEEPGMIDKVIPMAYNDLGLTCEEGDLYALAPNTKKKSIVWWEDNGTEMIEEQTYYYQCRSNLICIGWWNLPLINSELTNPSLLVANIIAAIPERLANVDYLSQIRVQFAGEEVSGSEVLSKYTLEEAENQFSTYPYAVTGIGFTVDFAFGKNCVDSVGILPSPCPPKMGIFEVLNFDGVDDFVELSGLVTAAYGSVDISFKCKIPSGQNFFTDAQVMLSFTDAAMSDGLTIYLVAGVGGTNPVMTAIVKKGPPPSAIKAPLDSYFDTELTVTVSKTLGVVNSITINGTSYTTAATSLTTALSNKHIGCRHSGVTELEFYKGLVWDIAIDDVIYYYGHPDGNEDSAWEDQVDSNDGTVNGNPTVTNP